MLVAIISDVHNNIVNLKKVLDYCQDEKIKTVICCGDLASQETLDFLNDNFSGDIYYTFGNMDDGQLRNLIDIRSYKHTSICNPFGEVTIDNKNTAFVHFPDIAKKLAKSGKYNFVFYGHTHKPWEEIVSSCKMLNPGNVAGELYPPTFAMWNAENDKFKLVRIHELK